MIRISDSFYEKFLFLLENNRKNVEDTITNSELFYSLSKKAFETGNFANHCYFLIIILII